jgi:hypothetical protein
MELANTEKSLIKIWICLYFYVLSNIILIKDDMYNY